MTPPNIAVGQPYDFINTLTAPVLIFHPACCQLPPRPRRTEDAMTQTASFIAGSGHAETHLPSLHADRNAGRALACIARPLILTAIYLRFHQSAPASGLVSIHWNTRQWSDFLVLIYLLWSIVAICLFFARSRRELPPTPLASPTRYSGCVVLGVTALDTLFLCAFYCLTKKPESQLWLALMFPLLSGVFLAPASWAWSLPVIGLVAACNGLSVVFLVLVTDYPFWRGLLEGTPQLLALIANGIVFSWMLIHTASLIDVDVRLAMFGADLHTAPDIYDLSRRIVDFVHVQLGYRRARLWLWSSRHDHWTATAFAGEHPVMPPDERLLIPGHFEGSSESKKLITDIPFRNRRWRYQKEAVWRAYLQSLMDPYQRAFTEVITEDAKHDVLKQELGKDDVSEILEIAVWCRDGAPYGKLTIDQKGSSRRFRGRDVKVLGCVGAISSAVIAQAQARLEHEVLLGILDHDLAPHYEALEEILWEDLDPNQLDEVRGDIAYRVREIQRLYALFPILAGRGTSAENCEQKCDVLEVMRCVRSAFARTAGECCSLRYEAERVVVRVPRYVVLAVLLNLVDNAIKYGGASAGTPAEIGVSVNDGQVELQIQDFGSGFPPNIIESFLNVARDTVMCRDTFHRADRAVGMSLARDLTVLWGGTFAPENTRPNGACVTVVWDEAPQ